MISEWEKAKPILIMLVRDKKITQKQIAQRVHVSDPGTIGDWLWSHQKPAGKYLASIVDLLKDMGYWEEKIQEFENVPLKKTDFIELPLLANIPAGEPEFYEGKNVIDKIPFNRRLADGAKYVIKCTGDSMEPSIQKGDLCLIRPETEPINNKVMVVQTPHGNFIKRVVAKNGIIELHSDNIKFKSYKLNEIKIRGQVVRVIKNIE